MMQQEDMKIAKHLKTRFEEENVPLVELRLYGSRARGEATDESDMDVFLIVEKIDNTIEEKIDRIAWEVGFKEGIVITTAEYTPHMIENTPLRASPFIQTVLRDGVTI
jgi:predicted nucleotidyltransferase